jgi:nitrogen fixation protein FixH
MTARAWFARGIEGRHVLGGLAGFFGVMLLANAIFVYFAVATFSGGDTSKPYQKGLDYNQTLEADALQGARGWQSEVAYDDKTGVFSLSVQDREGAPVGGLHIGAKLGRPATDMDDRHVVLKEASTGVYAASVDLAPGLWVISITSREAGEDGAGAYRLKRRLFVAERP